MNNPTQHGTVIFPTTLGRPLKAMTKVMGVLAIPPLLALAIMNTALTLGHVIIFSVVGVLFPGGAAACFWYLGRKSGVRIDATTLWYDNLPRRTVPLAAITSLDLRTVTKGQGVRVGIPFTALELRVMYGAGETLNIFVNFFERPTELLRVLTERCGHPVTKTPDAERFLQQLSHK